MSEHKLSKYMNKLKNASSAEKMDVYYAKVKHYKFQQSGGNGEDEPWKNYKTPSVDGLGKFKETEMALLGIIEDNGGNVDKLNENISAKMKNIVDKGETFDKALKSTLLYLKHIIDSIDINPANFQMIKPILDTLIGMKDWEGLQKYTPTELWEFIRDGKLTEILAVNEKKPYRSEKTEEGASAPASKDAKESTASAAAATATVPEKTV